MQVQYDDHRPRVAALRRERMRSRLIESALTLVAKNGVAATSIDDITSEAQVSRGTFYKYFDSPSALVEAVAKEVTNRLLALIDPVVLTHDDPVKRVATGVRLVLGLARTDAGYLFFNLAGQGVSALVMLPATFCAGMTLPLSEISPVIATPMVPAPTKRTLWLQVACARCTIESAPPARAE